jgi:hypothetical protein
MALTLEEKAVFEYRLRLAKKALSKKNIRFYAPALAGLPPEIRGTLTPQQLRNTMNAGTKNKQALIALEQLAGIVSPELQTIGV